MAEWEDGMNITACENCCILFDKDLINWPKDTFDFEDSEIYIWTGSDYSVFVRCPVCKEPIIKDRT